MACRADVCEVLTGQHSDILWKMQPIRQMETANPLVGGNNNTVAYASPLLAGSAQNQLVEGA